MQSPQFFSSLLSPTPQSFTKSHTLVELTHVPDLHLTAHALGVGVGVGAAKSNVTSTSTKSLSPGPRFNSNSGLTVKVGDSTLCKKYNWPKHLMI